MTLIFCELVIQKYWGSLTGHNKHPPPVEFKCPKKWFPFHFKRYLNSTLVCVVFFQVLSCNNDLKKGMGTAPISKSEALKVALELEPERIVWSKPKDVLLRKGESGKLGIKLHTYQVFVNCNDFKNP